MIFRALLIIFCTIFCNITYAAINLPIIAAGASLGLTFKKLNDGGAFSAEGNLVIKQVMFVIDEDVNQNAAVKIHIVIVYEKELITALKVMPASRYFTAVEQLKKDHPDKIKVFEWTFVAKKRITAWIDIPYDDSFLTPLGGFVFINYDQRVSPGENRAVIPKSWKKMKINCRRSSFDVVQDSESAPSTSKASPAPTVSPSPSVPSTSPAPTVINDPAPVAAAAAA